jgi:GDP-mannose pyrophosphatase NudK
VAGRIQRNEILRITPLLDGWSKVVRIDYRQLRREGTWQLQDRDLLDRGDGATVLLYNRHRRVVLLVRQPRIIATVHGFDDGETIEACSGQVDGAGPLETAIREVDEELGHRIHNLVPVAKVYASPGASLEMIHLFLGEYDGSTSLSPGGGKLEEGEDIEVLEVPFDQAMLWIEEGVIRDARTILVLQYAHIHRIFDREHGSA